MNILARLIKVIHWFVLIDIFLLIVGSTIYYFEFGYLDLEDLAPREFFWITWLCIIIPFIRYIIFGRFGWFPWTPFRKE